MKIILSSLLIILFLYSAIFGQNLTKDNLKKVDRYLALYYQAKYGEKFEKVLNDSINVLNIPLNVFEDLFPYGNKHNDLIDVMIYHSYNSYKSTENINGIEVCSTPDELSVHAKLDLNYLPEILDNPNIKFINSSKPIQLNLYKSASWQYTAAYTAHNAYGWKGKDVIIGIIDSGLDFDHDDFKDSNGDTRVLWYWNQNDDSGTNPSGFNYGSEYDATYINTNITTIVSDNHDKGHGTHVAGIAGSDGSSYANRNYTGMAPEADLIICFTFKTFYVLFHFFMKLLTLPYFGFVKDEYIF